MKNTIVAVIGQDSDAEEIMYKGLKDFPADKVVLIVEPEFVEKAARIRQDLARFGIAVEYEKIRNKQDMEELFIRIKAIKEREKENNLIINVETDYMSSCLALSSAFVNGIQAIGMVNDEIIAYPIMKFSYYTALSDKKLMILKRIREKGLYNSLEALGGDLKINLPLTVYHINGTPEKPGLESMGLVETRRKGRKVTIRLSKLGELLMKGAVDYAVGNRKGR